MADRELSDAKVELSKSRMELERQDLELSRLRAEVSHLIQDNKRLTNNLTTSTNGMGDLEALVDKLQDDKLKLSARVNKLISTGKLYAVAVAAIFGPLVSELMTQRLWFRMNSGPGRDINAIQTGCELCGNVGTIKSQISAVYDSIKQSDSNLR